MCLASRLYAPRDRVDGIRRSVRSEWPARIGEAALGRQRVRAGGTRQTGLVVTRKARESAEEPLPGTLAVVGVMMSDTHAMLRLMLRALLLAALLCACSAGPASAPPAAVTTPPSDCRAPWNGPAKDPKFAPLPEGQGRLPGRLASTDPMEVAYWRARCDFEWAHWDRAASEFREIAFGHPDAEVGIYAAELYVDSLEILRTQAQRGSCADEIARDVPRLIDIYCPGPGSPHEDACAYLDRLRAGLPSVRPAPSEAPE
jgi:hypothetical protein